MRSVADPSHDDRFEVVVDPTADPVDWDRGLARLLLRLVRKDRQSRPSPGTPAAAVEFRETPEAKRQVS